MSEFLQKFWSNKLKLWLQPIKPGEPIPEGYAVVHGPRTGVYIYKVGDKTPPPEPKKKKKVVGPEVPVNPDAPPPLYLEDILGRRMEDIPPEERMEQPWRLGKIAVKQTIHIPEHNRVINGKIKTVAAHNEYQATWMLPSQYYEGMAAGKHYELDHEKNEQFGVRLPTPEDPQRKHIHEGMMEPHPVNEIHKDEDADVGHRDEIERYDRAFNRQTAAEWMEIYRVDVDPNSRITIGGKPYEAFKYTVNGLQQPVYMFESGLEQTVVYSKEEGLKLFSKPPKALEYVRDLVLKYGKVPGPKDFGPESIESDESPDSQELVYKIYNLLQKAEALNTHIFSEYKSGDDNVVLNSHDDQYCIKVNDHEVMKTDNIGEAISKFYQEISKLIQAQICDKDTAINIFGEHVVQSNRKIIPMLNQLGKSNEASWLKNLDFSNITLPFNPDIIKYEPPNNVFPIVNTNDEMGQGAGSGERKPTKDGEVIEEEVDPTYQMTLTRHEQDPIVEKAISDKDIIDIGNSLSIPAELMDAFVQGYKIELEHEDTVNGDKIIVGKIARDHLNEDPDYYTKLETIEGSENEEDNLEKGGVWAPQFNLWLYTMRPGGKLPEGAVLWRGKRGGLYYYFPKGGPPGPRGEKQKPIRNVEPGHGVEVNEWGRARATQHPRGERMFEREKIRNPWGGQLHTRDFPEAVREGEQLNPEVDKVFAARAARGWGEDPRTPKMPIDPDRERMARELRERERREADQRVRDRAAIERERMLEEDRARQKRREERKRLAEIEARRREEEKLNYHPQELRNEYATILQQNSPDNVSVLGYDKLDPTIYAMVKEHLQKSEIELKIISDKVKRQLEYLGPLAKAVEDGVLNEIAPELNNKVDQLKSMEAKVKYLHNIVEPLKMILKFRDLDKNFPEVLVHRTITKACSIPTANKIMLEEPKDIKSLPGGTWNNKQKFYFKDGSKAAFKPRSGEVDIRSGDVPLYGGYLREVLTHDIDNILGFGVVPTTTFTLRKIDNKDEIASMQEWIGEGQEGQVDYDMPKQVKTKSADLEKLALLDLVIGNSDRHGLNFKTKPDGSVAAIDNGLTFPHGTNNHIRNSYISINSGKKIPEELINIVANNKSKIVSVVGHSLGEGAGLNTLKRINHIISNKTWTTDI